MAFHDTIYHAAGNAKLVTMLDNMREQIYRYRVEYLKDEHAYPTLIQEHRKILELLEKHEKEKSHRSHESACGKTGKSSETDHPRSGIGGKSDKNHPLWYKMAGI